MLGYAVQVQHESLGSAPPKLETVYVLAEDRAKALALVRTALRLDREFVEVISTLREDEVKTLRLRPFQVRHATTDKMPSIGATIHDARKRGDDKP